MRLSDFAPRINGIVPALTVSSAPNLRGIGSLGDVIADQITSYFNSFMGNLQWDLEHGMAATPAVVQETLTQAAIDSCAATAPTPCDPNSYATLIARYVAQYNTAYATASIALQSQVQSGQISVPSSYVAPNALNTSAPSPSASSVTKAVTINNVSGGSNSQFRVGDGFSVGVYGPYPNQQVIVMGTKNGISTGGSMVGITDGGGRATITGVFGPGDVGNWSETWLVGGLPLGQLSFSVVNASPTALTPPTNSGSAVTADQVSNAQTQGGSVALANGTSGSNVAASSSGIMDWLTSPISTSIPIPMWVVLAGGVVAVLAMKD